MDLLYYFLFIVFLLFILHQYVSTRNPKIANLPPGPWQLPIVGSLHHLLLGSPIPQRKLADLASKYGPLMHLGLGQLPVIVVSSADAAMETFKSNDLSFANRTDSIAAKIISYNGKDISFAPYGAYWRQMRKVCVVELLSNKQIQSMFPARQNDVAELVSSIRSEANGASPINLTKKLERFISYFTTKTAFGKRCKDYGEFMEALDQSKVLFNGLDLADFFPSWSFVGTISGIKRKATRLNQAIDRIAESIIKERREMRAKTREQEEKDILGLLLRLQERDDAEFPLTDDTIKAIIFDIFAGGSETSVTLMDWAMSEMLRNPRVMERAQSEVREVFQGKEVVTQEDIHQLEYLKLVIKETLRLHPSIPLIPRKARNDCEMGGYNIPGNAAMLVNVWLIGRDPKYWNKPHQFWPERFRDAAIDFKGTNYEYIPFGSGRRMCPGMSFGMAMVELVLAQLLYHFDWKLPHGMPEDMDMTEVESSGWQRRKNLLVHAIPFFPRKTGF